LYYVNGESAVLFSKLSSLVPGSETGGRSENCIVCIIRAISLGCIRRPEQKWRTKLLWCHILHKNSWLFHQPPVGASRPPAFVSIRN
jgi:hypothetical protein